MATCGVTVFNYVLTLEAFGNCIFGVTGVLFFAPHLSSLFYLFFRLIFVSGNLAQQSYKRVIC